MPQTFIKDVIKPGTYWPRDVDGKAYRLDVSLDRIRHWSKETNRMLKNGNNIPMPWVHDKEAVPWLEGKPRPGSYDNGAYLKRMRVRKDGMLVAELEAGTDEDAEKIGKSVKDVSFFSPKEEWTDGNGKTYKDVFTHLAMVNHPVVVGQENFVPTDGLAAGLMLSLDMALHGGSAVSSETSHLGNPEETSSGNTLDSMLELLAEHGFELPEDTDETNFRDRLWTALVAVKSFKEKSEGDAALLDEPPQGAKRQQPAPLAMATDQELQFAVETLSAGTENPSTKSPWTVDELKAAHAVQEAAKPKLEFSAEQNAQLAAIQHQAKLPILSRIEGLVTNKVVTPTYAQEKLIPMLDKTGLTFSQEEETLGQVVQDTPLHMALEVLEALSSGSAIHNRENLNDSVNFDGHKFSLGEGLTVQDRPKEWEQGENKEDNTKTADRMAGYIG